jgi:hypothetical protein
LGPVRRNYSIGLINHDIAIQTKRKEIHTQFYSSKESRPIFREYNGVVLNPYKLTVEGQQKPGEIVYFTMSSLRVLLDEESHEDEKYGILDISRYQQYKL